MFILGMDIGYSNLKNTFGVKGETPTTKVLPVGAGPIELMPQRLTGGMNDCIQVVIDGEKWVAGVEPDRLQGWERELHHDYPSTKSYKALFYASLLQTEQTVIDVLVTGLPVEQFCNLVRREQLQKRLEGTHKITPKRSVEVRSVIVVPQPAGAYMDLVYTTEDQGLLEIIEEGKTVICDPGFFSTDWVALEAGEVRYQSSGTSLKAMSMLLEETQHLIRDDHGSAPDLAKLEKAVRSGKPSIILLGQKIDIADYLAKASKKVSQSAFVPLRKSMREEGLNADVVLLTGGGAAAYLDAAKEVFPGSRTIVLDHSVSANSRGFWFCG